MLLDSLKIRGSVGIGRFHPSRGNIYGTKTRVVNAGNGGGSRSTNSEGKCAVGSGRNKKRGGRSRKAEAIVFSSSELEGKNAATATAGRGNEGDRPQMWGELQFGPLKKGWELSRPPP